MKDHTDFFAFRPFRIEIDGVALGTFDGFVPPGREARLDDARERLEVRDVPARLLVGWANTRDLLSWFEPVLRGEPVRRSVVVVQLGPGGEPVARHRLEGAWPVRLKLATLTAEGPFEIDELELSVAGWQFESAQPPGQRPGDAA